MVVGLSLTLGMGFVLASVTAARADAGGALLGSSYYELSPMYANGGITFPGGNEPIKASGVHIYERNGIGGKIVATTFIAFLLAAGRSDTEYLGSTYGSDYRVDHYRVKSADEMAAEDRQRQASISQTAANEYQMDVQIYWPQDGYTTASGFSWALVPWSWGSADSFVVELGFLWTRLHDYVCHAEMAATVSERCVYSNFGSPLRVAVPVTPYAVLDLQWDLNWLALADDEHGVSHASPVRASLTLSPFERLFARGGVVASSLDPSKVGFVLEAGLRF